MSRHPREILQQYGLKPNKALGQNFLASREVCEQIAEACRCEGETVLEIGPGLGALTGCLLRAAGRVVAVEKDGGMVRVLRQEYPDPRLELEEMDALELDIRSRMGQEPFVAAGNLPYYITTPVSEKILCAEPGRAVLMVQKEAADRFLAKPGDRVYGPLSILSDLLYCPELLFPVPRNCFWPQPEIDSAVVRLERKPDRAGETAEPILRFLKNCFRMRRKTLRNQFAGNERMQEIISETGLDGARAESLSPEELYDLFIKQREEQEHV